MKKFNFYYLANLDTIEKQIKYIEKRKDTTDFSWRKLAGSVIGKISPSLIEHFEDEIPESIWELLPLNNTSLFDEEFICKYLGKKPLNKHILNFRKVYSNEFLEKTENFLDFRILTGKAELTPDQIKRYFFKLDFDELKYNTNLVLIRNIPKDLFLSNLEYLSKKFGRHILGKVAYILLTEDEFLQYSDKFGVKLIYSKELTERVAAEYVDDLIGRSAISKIVPTSKSFVKSNMKHFNYYIRIAAYLERLLQTGDESLYDALEEEIAFICDAEKDAFRLSLNPLDFKTLFQKAFMRPNLAKKLAILCLKKGTCKPSGLESALSIMKNFSISVDDFLSIQDQFNFSQRDIALATSSFRDLSPDRLKENIPFINLPEKDILIHDSVSFRDVFTQINDVKIFENFLSTPNSFFVRTLKETAAIRHWDDEISADIIRLDIEIWKNHEEILRLFDEYLKSVFTKLDYKNYKIYKHHPKRFFLASVKMAGPQFRQIFISNLVPDKVKIGCTYYTKDNAIKAIEKRYSNHVPTKEQYINCVEECFKKANEVKKNL